MKRYIPIVVSLFLIHAVVDSCGPGENGGVVLIVRSGDGPLPGAVATFEDLEQKADDNGILYANAVPIGSYAVRISHPGYASTIRRITVRPENVVTRTVQLMRERSQFIDATSDSTIRAANHTIDIPAGTLETTAPVKMEYSFFTPDDSPDAMPGGFVGERANNETVPIVSYGAISLTAISGESEVQIRPGRFITVRFPASADSPETVPLWYLDEARGIWIEEGEARLIRSGSQAYYEADLPHLSYWNIDEPLYDRAAVWVKNFVDEDGEAVEGITLLGIGVSYQGVSESFHAYANNADVLGSCIDVKANSTVDLRVQEITRDLREFTYTRRIRSGRGGTSCVIDPSRGTVIDEIALKETQPSLSDILRAIWNNFQGRFGRVETIEMDNGRIYSGAVVGQSGDVLFMRTPGGDVPLNTSEIRFHSLRYNLDL